MSRLEPTAVHFWINIKRPPEGERGTCPLECTKIAQREGNRRAEGNARRMLQRGWPRLDSFSKKDDFRVGSNLGSG